MWEDLQILLNLSSTSENSPGVGRRGEAGATYCSKRIVNIKVIPSMTLQGGTTPSLFQR